MEPTKKTFSSTLLKFIAWTASVCLLISGTNMLLQSEHIYGGIACILLGLFLLPPILTVIRAKTNGRLGRKGIAGIGVLGLITASVGNRIDMRIKEQADKAKTAAEWRTKLAHDSLENFRDSVFIAAHPFVSAGDYRALRHTMADSATIPPATVEKFLADQKYKQDSIEWARKADSIAQITRRKNDSMAIIAQAKQARKDSIANARSAKRSTYSSDSRSSSTSRGDYSNGRQIYTGPRGGRYYLSPSGKKVYIR